MQNENTIGTFLRMSGAASSLAGSEIHSLFMHAGAPCANPFAHGGRGEYVVEALREPAVPEEAIASESERRWQRLPLFLHMRASKAR
jgi:hypothetical protein